MSREQAIPVPEEVAEAEQEVYQGEIAWHRLSDGRGRLFRFALVELSERAGRRFLGGADARYKLVVLLDGYGRGHAYAFATGGEGSGDYLAPLYVQEKLGGALTSPQDVLTFTRALARLLARPSKDDEQGA